MHKSLQWKRISFNLLKISWGLLVHPYQSMQSLVKNRHYVWLLLLPTLFLFMSKLLWILVVTPLVQIIYSCGVHYFIGCQIVNILANWLTFFCVYWQIMLLYLAMRFSRINQFA